MKNQHWKGIWLFSYFEWRCHQNIQTISIVDHFNWVQKAKTPVNKMHRTISSFALITTHFPAYFGLPEKMHLLFTFQTDKQSESWIWNIWFVRLYWLHDIFISSRPLRSSQDSQCSLYYSLFCSYSLISILNFID